MVLGFYLPNKSDADNPMVSPPRTKSFTNLPRTYLIAGEYDLLRDEGEAYAKQALQSI